MFFEADDSAPSRFTLSMDDVGTREKHCNQLLDIWNGGLYILLAKSEASRSPREIDMIAQLTYAVELLKKHLTGVNGSYNEAEYRKVIDALPKAEEIKD